MRQTTLQVVMPVADSAATLRIGDGQNFAALAFQGTSATASLSAGDYVITLDANQAASLAAPYQVTSDVDTLFMTAGPPRGDGVRRLITGVSRVVVESDPKDPWPPLLLSGGTPAEISLLAASPILQAMQTLLDANGGKGSAGGAPPAIHAILIGIDAYTAGPGHDGTIYRPLRGCVRDILEVEGFLREVGVPAHRITRLIAPNADGPGNELAVPPESIPTYDHIVAAWQRVAATASKGDIVYIHYSGHGGRTQTLFPAIKPDELDESIAPCDVNLPDGRHLRDVEIAVLLRQLAQRELLTTLVLDSCYAGSATRGDEAQARRGDTDDLRPRTGQSADNSAVAPRAELEAMARLLVTSPRDVGESWRIDPTGAESSPTTVIAACRRNESSYEYAVDGEHRGGALTHFWLEALRQRGATMTYRAAYRHTFARVQAVFKEQSPVLIGAADRQVLGVATLAQPTSIAVLEVVGDEVALAAGTSGMVSIGARLAVLPNELLPELVDLTAMPQVEVTSAQASRARARLVEPGTPPRPIALDSHAVILTYAPIMRRSVRWLASQLPSDSERVAHAQFEAEIAADPSRVIGFANAEAAHYQVAIEQSRFVILDPAGSPLPNLRPDIASTGERAAGAVAQRLVHLARFHNVRELTNSDPNSPLAGKLELSLHAAQADRVGDALPVRPVLPCDAEFYLRIRNRSARALSMAIFDLGADWSIAHVNRRAPLTLESGMSIDLRMITSLPDGYEFGPDVLKVIGTLDQTELDWLTLPTLARADAPRPATRGPCNRLEALMAMMHEPAHATRSVALAAAPTLGWTEAQIALEVRR
jgi:hypothetical protein